MDSGRAERGTPTKALGRQEGLSSNIQKVYFVGEDSEENYDVIDIQIEAQKAVTRITDHLEIVKQYQKVVRTYNNFEQDFPWESRGGLQQDNCWFGDMLKDEKRKSQFKYDLGKLMGDYAVPLPLGNST